MNSTFKYDTKNDILVVHEGFSNDEKFEGNADLGQLVLGVSNKGRIRGIEIMNASVFLKEFGIEKEMLERMTEAKIDAYIKSEVIMLSITIKASKRMRVVKIAVPITLKQEAGILFA